ncbi:MAG: hypothetical protein D8M57_18600 [Candidatus Scalindua sp. AMX11]|nr:MAG: hypothetical protein DWQ00_02940 [Candidatus Scalindua sp.]NOG82231.1 hypothetical protein [Planctomycetota bacterium]RZV65513.1 MAG: hypothetical protein EX341_18080 [Candidatus Scalindua sp. SCAELEC01]TDE63393.1 MAG: hypothetical protein D8M57_18600 [Candidatus Scalindua sp. AMX11]GJQ57249.1 MAG: hypothetical protein SCALA701_00500 [Candidatus Scalindua sp.]
MRITHSVKHLLDITLVQYLPLHGISYRYSLCVDIGKRTLSIFYTTPGHCLSFTLVFIMLGVLTHRVQANPFELFKNETWCYFKGDEVPDPDWKVIDFDDTEWKIGSGGFGYGNDHENNVILDDMKGNYVSLFIRRKFTVDNPDTIKEILLHIDTDGPYVAYLNGIKVCQNMCRSTGPTDITGIADELLIPGTNVLCVKGSNDDLDSDDFSFKAWLEIIKE